MMATGPARCGFRPWRGNRPSGPAQAVRKDEGRGAGAVVDRTGALLRREARRRERLARGIADPRGVEPGDAVAVELGAGDVAGGRHLDVPGPADQLHQGRYARPRRREGRRGGREVSHLSRRWIESPDLVPEIVVREPE